MANIDAQKINRYPGVKPFSEKDDELFFGRKSDIETFDSLLFVKQNVVLYGKSGYGKSSLINAGIIPLLKQEEVYIYFLLRFNNYSEKKSELNLTSQENINLKPLQTVKKRLSENISVNVNSDFYKLMPGEDSLWYWIKQNQLESNKTKFIIFFDQFEELFTYPKEEVAEFSEQLSQLLYGTVPVNYRKRIDELNESDTINNKLGEFLYEKPEVKAVYSIRGDRLALMNALTDRHPSILQNLYELDALTESDARLAIIEPARLTTNPKFKTGTFTYTEGAVNKIIKNVANQQDRKVETSTLQIICRYIEDTLVAEQGNTIITEELLGNITDIFQQYYESILNKLTESDRVKVQHLIEDLLISGDQRNSFTMGYIQVRFNITTELLGILEQSSLLRKERDASGKILYEISHDSIVGAINKIAEKRKKEEDEIKKADLEKQIEQEKLRSENLLNLNKTSVFRFRLAMGMLVIAIIAVILAVSQKEKAISEKKIADSARNNAIEKETIAKAELYDNNFLRADEYIDRAETFMNSDDYNYAKTDLVKADSLIDPHVSLSAQIEIDSLQTKINTAQKKKLIESLLKKCNEKK